MKRGARGRTLREIRRNRTTGGDFDRVRGSVVDERGPWDLPRKASHFPAGSRFRSIAVADRSGDAVEGPRLEHETTHEGLAVARFTVLGSTLIRARSRPLVAPSHHGETPPQRRLPGISAKCEPLPGAGATGRDRLGRGARLEASVTDRGCGQGALLKNSANQLTFLTRYRLL